MLTERVQRRIDRLLDQAEEAVDGLLWERVREVSQSVIAVDPENVDANAFLAMAEPHLELTTPPTDSSPAAVSTP
ncbi:MAG: hypothetical protein IH960_09365, partial [Chloroflexi bacterium]|nr:hypothetical protein [Chloroflexota bacterium]